MKIPIFVVGSLAGAASLAACDLSILHADPADTCVPFAAHCGSICCSSGYACMAPGRCEAAPVDVPPTFRRRPDAGTGDGGAS